MVYPLPLLRWKMKDWTHLESMKRYSTNSLRYVRKWSKMKNFGRVARSPPLQMLRLLQFLTFTHSSWCMGVSNDVPDFYIFLYKQNGCNFNLVIPKMMFLGHIWCRFSGPRKKFISIVWYPHLPEESVKVWEL